MTHHARSRPRLGVERLEVRDQPSAAPDLVEPFQRGPVNGMPAGWAEWSSDGSRAFQVNPTAPGLGDTGLLTSTGSSTTAARAWVAAPFPADVDATVAVYLNSAVPAQVLVRGQSLNTTTPTYYAASVTRGGDVQLLRVVHGKATVLAAVHSTDYVSNHWVQVRVVAEGGDIRVLVSRGDTNQYLAPNGTWQRTPVAAIDKTDTAIKAAGQVGFARPPQAAGVVDLDSLRVGPAGPPAGRHAGGRAVRRRTDPRATPGVVAMGGFGIPGGDVRRHGRRHAAGGRGQFRCPGPRLPPPDDPGRRAGVGVDLRR
jgi:hypothetical protein